MPILKDVITHNSENVTVLVFNEGVGLLANSAVKNERIHIALCEVNTEDPEPPDIMGKVDVILDFYGKKGLRSFINYLEKVHKKAENS